MTDAPVVDPVGAKPKKKPAAKKAAAAASIEAPAPSKRIKPQTVRPKIETSPSKSWLQPQWMGLAAVLGLLVALLWPMFGPTTAPQTVTAIEPAAPIEHPLPSPCLNGQGQACFAALRDDPAYEFLPNDVQRRGYDMACELGTAPACQLVAAWHKTGIGGPINLMTSLDYYDEACRLKDPNGCIERAMILNDPGSGLSQDKDTAIALLKRACNDLSSTRACNILTFDQFQSAPAQNASQTRNKTLPDACLRRQGVDCYSARKNDPNYEFLTNAARRDGYRIACESGAAPACALVAQWHKLGIGGSISYVNSIYYNNKACQLNEPTGCIERALILIEPPPKSYIKPDKPAAIAALKRACDELSSTRACDLLQTARFQTAAPPMPATPPHKLVENLRLQNRTGEIINLRSSLSFQKSKNEAAIALLTSCLNDNGVSCQEAAWQIYDKRWAAPDYPNAQSFLAERACALGNASGCWYVGIDFEFGDFGRSKSASRAFDFHGVACELGQDYGCSAVARLIVDKVVTGKSYSSVENKVNEACSNGNGSACTVIGLAFERGFVNDIKDLNRAAPFYEKACNLDEAWGCTNLGFFYENGKGGKTVSKSEAKKLYTKACSLGHKDACDWAKQNGE